MTKMELHKETLVEVITMKRRLCARRGIFQVYNFVKLFKNKLALKEDVKKVI